MGGVEDDEPPSKRVKVTSVDSGGISNSVYLRQRGCSFSDSMARLLASEGDDVVVGSKGFIKKVELVRVISEALYSLGYSKSGACLEEESGIPFHAPVVDLFMRQILEGQWDESVSVLHKIGVIDETIIKLASLVIFEQKFFELLYDGKIMDALKTLRTEITPLCKNYERVRELSLFIVSPPQNLLDGTSSKGSKSESRKKLLEKLRKLLPPTVIVPEQRLVHLVEQALVLQKDACKFHNSSVGKMSLLADHQCGRDHIPTRTLQVLQEHNDEVWFLQFSHNGKYLASSSGDHLVIIWEVMDDGQVSLKHRLHGHQKPVSCISWSPDDNQLLTCGVEEVVRRWDVALGECLHTYDKSGLGLVSCAWAPDGKSIFSGVTDKSICMWDVEGKELECWRGQRTLRIADLGLTSNTNELISVCKETIILLFGWESKSERFVEEDQIITSFSLSEDGKFLLLSLLNEELHLWNIDGCPRLVSKYKGHKRSRYVVQSCFGGLEHAFIASGSEDSQERAAVHTLSRRAGFRTQSHGKGLDRRIHVYKLQKGAGNVKERENLASFRFSGESQAILQDLFSRYPPNDVDMTENKVEASSGKTDNEGVQRDDFFCRPTTNPTEIASKVQSLASRIEKEPSLREIAQDRSKLPITSFRDAITSTVDSNQVVLVCGETGCGKTTQVPQFLLDHAWSKGETCKVVCTQPRRISATSVAERIASERGEKIGETVGYKIRLETTGGRQSSLVFCTNGVLLRVLVSKRTSRTTTKKASKKLHGTLADMTHVIVDEIHERDRFSDFMLAIIRDLLPLYPHLRLILMSATIDAERFSKYFGGCPVIRVPGFTYPVKSFYLEDVLSMVRSTENNHLTCSNENEKVKDSPLTEESRVALDEAIDLALSNDEFDPLLLELISTQGDSRSFDYQHSKTGVTPLMVLAGQGKVSHVCTLLSLGANCDLRCNAGKTALNYAELGNQGEAAEIIKKHMGKAFTYSEEEQKLLDKYLSNADPELIDCLLIEQLLRRICNDSTDGAVLVFLPGWDDINRTREKLLSSPYFKDPSKFLIIALHSMVPLVEQKKVFKRPPRGCRKIVLSTNIAETSVTIDDVVHVIDSGRMKEKSYDPYSNVSTLHSSWISTASVKQREGRAGRCRPGICYHLFSKARAASLPDFQVPEIKRTPIEELCLQVKLMDPYCKIEEFLQKTLDPPVYETIRNAIMVLQDIGALSLDEQLTELGEKLGALPVHPLTSKMLFFAILLNCLDPALTLACASNYRDPFILPMLSDEKKKAQAARLELATLYGGSGDQLAIIAAFDCWKMAKEKGEQARFCSQFFVSSTTMRMISGMRKQLEGELVRHGYIPKDASCCSLNARDPGILHAVVFAGLYPMVGRIVQQGNRSLVETASGNRVRLHQFSTNAKLSSKKCSIPPLIMFDEVTRGDGGMHIRNCSVVGPLPLMLLATEIVVAPTGEDDDGDEESDAEEPDAGNDSDEEERVEPHSSSKSHNQKILSSPENVVKLFVDRWLPFHSTALDVAQIYCLRERLTAAILFKATHPRRVIPEHLGASLYAIACILSYDGMSGISLPPEPVNALVTMVGNADIGHGKKMAISRPSKSYLESLVYQNYPSSQNQSQATHRHAHGTRAARHNFSKSQRGNGNGH